ncbi:MAG: trypsin-like peptidase domain-containing protein [Clostridiales bacterium]|nr:trypsin-like peptidase domain-containing protein [Clostridiales bacterium]
MKKYPHTDSTDLMLYNVKPKKNKKPRTWLVALSSAVAASLLTGAVCMTGTYMMTKHDASEAVNNAPVTAQAQSGTDAEVSTLATYKNGKKVLTIPEIAEKVGPSVVGVINKTTVQPQRYYDPFSGRYQYYGQEGTVEQGSGSGIIISNDGYIVTNQHVIDGATEISVILNTGDETNATLVGQDSKTDLAVLKIETDTELTPAVLGDSSAVEVGELAVAIGNPMGMEFSGSVTAGIISAVNRTITIEDKTYNLLQTDAAINSGNSGGALINQYGEVIGINSVKLSSTGVEGMGFAIAISEAKPIIDDLMQTGYVTGRPLVGIQIQNTPYGLFIANVQENTGAAEAGMQVGDMIISVDGKNVKSADEINEIRDTKKPGDTMDFIVSRNGEKLELSVKLTENIEQAKK